MEMVSKLVLFAIKVSIPVIPVFLNSLRSTSTSDDEFSSVFEFASIINQLTGNQSGVEYHLEKRSEGDPDRRQPDISLALDVLNWQPEIRLEDGLTKTIDYFKKELGIP